MSCAWSQPHITMMTLTGSRCRGPDRDEPGPDRAGIQLMVETEATTCSWIEAGSGAAPSSDRVAWPSVAV